LKPDVLIIGGGIVGASLAYEFSKYQLDVVLLEKEAELSFGVSKANSGIVHTGFQSDPSALKTRLAVRGNTLYKQLAKLLDFPLVPVGELVVAFPGELEGLKRMKDTGEQLGIPGLEIVNRNWLDEKEPSLSKNIQFALLGPTADVFNPYETVYAMAEQAAANGVRIYCEHEVTAIQPSNGLWQVQTRKAAVTSRYVVNAAGLYSDKIAMMAGIEVPHILPWKGEEYLLDRHAKWLTKRVIFPLPRKETKGVLVIPTVDGNTMIGPTAEAVPDCEEHTTSRSGKLAVLANVRNLIPALKEEQIIASFAGVRPTTSEGDFHIREDREGFINLVGIQSPGLTAAPAIAEEVAKILSQSMELIPRKGYVAKRTAIPRFRLLSSKERNDLIKKNPDFGEIVCRCELVTKAEVKEAIRRGARTLDGIKFRTRTQMGRCHGSFCTMKIMSIMAEELHLPYEAISKRGKGTELIKM
jgi:glycerol-3-phosphate dehydrogenase